MKLNLLLVLLFVLFNAASSYNTRDKTGIRHYFGDASVKEVHETNEPSSKKTKNDWVVKDIVVTANLRVRPKGW
ncbi:hypothetical protein Bhyg_13480, partial [Pseudolycoriella hygida]